MVPGSTTAVPPNGAPPIDGVNTNRFTLATLPVDPLASNASRSLRVPAFSGTWRTVTVFQVCQPPVFGTCTAPVAFTPSTSRCNRPPDPVEASLNARSYCPSAATFTVYWSHSLGRVQPTS